MKFYSLIHALFNWKLLLLPIIAVNLIGCASIVSGTDQAISVETWQEGNEIEGTHCELKNKKGEYKVVAPATVMVQRSSDDLIIACRKEDLPKGLARADSGLNSAVFGNILLGGLIGLGVDAATGALNEYPDLIVIHFGKNLLIEDENNIEEVEERDIYITKSSKKKKTSSQNKQQKDNTET